MPKVSCVTEGVVEAVLITPFGESCSQAVNAIQIIAGYGIKGDRHAGTRLSDSREHVLAAMGVGKEVPIANVREFTAIAMDDRVTVDARMGVSVPSPPGLWGENLCISGIEDLTHLPCGTLLSFSPPGITRRWRKAVLAVWAENDACHVPGENIRAYNRAHGSPDFEPTKPFGIAARGIR